MKNWFDGCETIADAKKTYHELMMKYHPDKGGDVEISKEINNAFEAYCKDFMENAFYGYEKETGKTAYANKEFFAEILKQACDINCRVEVIGFWIYCFDAKEVYQEIKKIVDKNGKRFWFSGRHLAWVYNGEDKVNKKKKYFLTTDKVRQINGFDIVREKEEQKKITA